MASFLTLGADADPLLLVCVALTLFVALVVVFPFLYFGVLWIRARLAGVPVLLVTLIGMKLRRVPPRLIVDTMIALKERGVTVAADELERLYLANSHARLTPAQLTERVLAGETEGSREQS